MRKIFVLVCCVSVLLSLLFWGCSPRIPDDQPFIELSNAWARTLTNSREVPKKDDLIWKTPVGPLGLGPNGIVYLTINNKGGAADKLVGASSDVADKTELHLMVLSGQQTFTYLQKSVDIPARAITEFKTGSYYIRLVGLRRELANGATFKLTLEFQKSGKKAVDVSVQNP
jgi:copper(I)-binding protein